MTSWTADELDPIAGEDELRIATRRADGSLRPALRIWFVRAGDELFVRSAYGPKNGWYVRARASRSGRISIGSFQRDVTFEEPDHTLDENLHRSYREKYARHPASSVATVVSDDAARCTLRVVPAS